MIKKAKIDEISERAMAVMSNSPEFSEVISIYNKGMKTKDINEVKDALCIMFNESNLNMMRCNVLKVLKSDELNDDEKLNEYLDDYTKIYLNCMQKVKKL